MHDHFKGKEAIQHIVEVQAEGMLTTAEIHGAETPGFLFAATDAAKESAVALLLIAVLLSSFEFVLDQVVLVMLSFSAGWLFWKIGRASWLAWSRLERLHRVMNEERYEIEHNRAQEREELKALYHAKGFQGKLLDDVIDVLMADGDRALRVMLEEELGFRLEENEHPLIQGLGAGLGVLVASLAVMLSFAEFGFIGLGASVAIVLGLSAIYPARREHNKAIPAVLWNLGLALFAYLVSYYCMHFLTQ